jgi:hypothetical protein
MRITKKFAGSNGIGKQVFSPCLFTERSNEVKRALFSDMESLEKVFLQKVEANQNISFPVSAKALAFSVKLQLQVQHAPQLTHDSILKTASAHRMMASSNNSQKWSSRFDSTNTNSITANNNTSSNQPNVGEKRAKESIKSAPAEKKVKRTSVSSDLDASNLLLNFFKSNQDKDSSDIDSDSNESSTSNYGGNLSGGSTSLSSTTGLRPYFGGDSTGNTTGSGSDDQEESINPKSSKASHLLPF